MGKATKIKYLKFGMIASGILTIMIAKSDFIIKKLIKLALKIDMSGNEAASIAIIGGADGPTAIFLAGNQTFNYKYIWMSVFLAITVLCFLLWRKASKLR